jgi:hypothetical protein
LIARKLKGIPLTGAESQISVRVLNSSEMSIPRTTKQRSAAIPLWQIFTCILLAGLFLYNPFLAISKASGNLMVCHPASYRSTIASSELEQFTPPNSCVADLLPDTCTIQDSIPRVVASTAIPRRYVEQVVVATPQTGFSSSLWFRPPPAV